LVKSAFGGASALIAVAKARIFIEEGWKIHITDEDGRIFDPVEFHLLLAVNEITR
jgi:hypothetical protein